MPKGSILLLTASVAVVGSNALVLSPVAGAVAASLAGATPADVMLASAVYGLGTAASALLIAPKIDRLGADAVLLRAICVLAAALAASAAAPGLATLCAAQGLAGLAAGVALPAAYALCAQVAEKGFESRTLGVVLTGWTISMVAGVSLSAALADVVHWRAVFAVLAGAAAVLALRLIGRRDWGERPPNRGSTSPLSALGVPGIAPALAVCACYMIAFYGLYSYLGAHAQGELGRSTALTGLTALAYGAGFGIAAPFDRIIDRRGAERIAPAVFAALVLVYLAIALSASSFAALVGLCLAWGIANHLGLNLIVGRLTRLDAGQRGSIMGLYSAVTYLCVFASALGYRAVFEAAGFAACAVLSAVCVVPAAADAARFIRRARGGALSGLPFVAAGDHGEPVGERSERHLVQGDGV